MNLRNTNKKGDKKADNAATETKGAVQQKAVKNKPAKTTVKKQRRKALKTKKTATKNNREYIPSTRIGMSLPDDLLEQADDFVYQSKKGDKGYSRSQLVQDALRAYLKKHA